MHECLLYHGTAKNVTKPKAVLPRVSGPRFFKGSSGAKVFAKNDRFGRIGIVRGFVSGVLAKVSIRCGCTNDSIGKLCQDRTPNRRFIGRSRLALEFQSALFVILYKPNLVLGQNLGKLGAIVEQWLV